MRAVLLDSDAGSGMDPGPLENRMKHYESYVAEAQARLDQAGSSLALALLRIDPTVAAARGPRGGGALGVNPLSGNGHCQIPF